MNPKSRLAASREEAIDRIRSLLSLQPSANQLSAQSSSPCSAESLNRELVAVIPAAGRGERSGLTVPKQYHRLAGITMLARSVRAIASFFPVRAVVVVLDPHDETWQSLGLESELADFTNVVAVRIGGLSRRESVMAGCTLLREALGFDKDAGDPWVMVHDAARPAVSASSLARLWQCVDVMGADNGYAGAILALPVTDTIKRAAANTNGAAPLVSETVDRSTLWAAQTPQMFRLDALIDAYQRCSHATDEAAAMESVGAQVMMAIGDAMNIKLTTPEDFVLMESLMSEPTMPSASSTSPPPFAIGQGFDVHALVEGRPLIIGGIRIPYVKGLAGHSDADVLLHAITDAILGAAAMGDIGRHFPDNDPAHKGADSLRLLAEVVAKVAAVGWRIAQIDATVIAQAPKIAPYAQAMVQAIARCCDLEPAKVNVKGKTTEHLGFTGRGEGIAAQAIAMLVKIGV